MRFLNKYNFTIKYSIYIAETSLSRENERYKMALLFFRRGKWHWFLFFCCRNIKISEKCNSILRGIYVIWDVTYKVEKWRVEIRRWHFLLCWVGKKKDDSNNINLWNLLLHIYTTIFNIEIMFWNSYWKIKII